MIDYLGKEVKVVIDRPLGSIHPEHNNLYYIINYGYIPDTFSGDGEEIAAYVIGEFIPIKVLILHLNLEYKSLVRNIHMLAFYIRKHLKCLPMSYLGLRIITSSMQFNAILH